MYIPNKDGKEVCITGNIIDYSRGVALWLIFFLSFFSHFQIFTYVLTLYFLRKKKRKE